MSKFHLSDRSKLNRSGAHPQLIQISDLAIQITRIDFGHGRLSASRITEEQNQLFKDNKSKCDGYKKLSYHQVADDLNPELPELSDALDFFAYVDGKAIWSGEAMAVVACSFLQAASVLGFPCQSGVLWGWDAPHIQRYLPDGR